MQTTKIPARYRRDARFVFDGNDRLFFIPADRRQMAHVVASSGVWRSFKDAAWHGGAGRALLPVKNCTKGHIRCD
jgi:hypothetical protein